MIVMIAALFQVALTGRGELGNGIVVLRGDEVGAPIHHLSYACFTSHILLSDFNSKERRLGRIA